MRGTIPAITTLDQLQLLLKRNQLVRHINVIRASFQRQHLLWLVLEVDIFQAKAAEGGVVGVAPVEGGILVVSHQAPHGVVSSTPTFSSSVASVRAILKTLAMHINEEEVRYLSSGK